MSEFYQITFWLYMAADWRNNYLFYRTKLYDILERLCEAVSYCGYYFCNIHIGYDYRTCHGYDFYLLNNYTDNNGHPVVSVRSFDVDKIFYLYRRVYSEHGQVPMFLNVASACNCELKPLEKIIRRFKQDNGAQLALCEPTDRFGRINYPYSNRWSDPLSGDPTDEYLRLIGAIS